MAAKDNIVTNKTSSWDELKDKTIDESLAIIYDLVNQKSEKMCDWYWRSIKSKKKSSLIARAFSVVFLVIGTMLPIVSAVLDTPECRLIVTQAGVAFLVLAGLLTLTDRIFGWSSGWMRYIQTVTSMENLVSIYQMEWRNYIAFKTKPLESSDLKALFDLTIALQNELINLLSDETNKWIVEFNASISLLETSIKAQRDEAEKKLDAIRTSLSEKNKEQQTRNEANENGSIQVNFSYKDNKPIKLKLKLDATEPVDLLGFSWAKLEIKPGPHILNIETDSNPPQTIEKILDVKPSAITEISVKIEM